MAGKAKGTENYKREALLEAVSRVMPTRMSDWRTVYAKYQILASDTTERQPEDVKRYFWRTMCNKGIKPTDKAAPNPMVKQALKVWAEILKKNHVASYGADNLSTDDEEDDNDDSCEDDNDKDVPNDNVAVDNSDEVSALSMSSATGIADARLFSPLPAVDINSLPQSGEKNKAVVGRDKKSGKRQRLSEETDGDANRNDSKSKKCRDARQAEETALMKMADAMERYVKLRAMEVQQNYELNKMKLKLQMLMAAACTGNPGVLEMMNNLQQESTVESSPATPSAEPKQ